MDRAARPFSRNWMLASMAAFIGSEIVIGGFLGELLIGRMTSINTGFLLQGLLNLAGYAVGGFIIGTVSPGRRITEPAAGAFLTILLTAIVAIFVPFRYIGYSGGGILLAGALAAAIGGGGAYAGEKLTGNAPNLTP